MGFCTKYEQSSSTAEKLMRGGGECSKRLQTQVVVVVVVAVPLANANSKEPHRRII